MYTLMNKNTPLIDFDFVVDTEFGTAAIKELNVYKRPWFIPALKTWIDKRHAPKHRQHIDKLLSALGLHGGKALLEFSKGLSLTDTLWVNKDDRYIWERVNLFDNPFDEVIARIAFDGGLHGKQFSTTSPELTTDGAFAKCWIREDSGDIYLIKQGSSGASNAGLEPYSEQYCSEILDILGYAHVQYSVVQYHGKLASKCKLLTSQNQMMLPMAQCLDDYEFPKIARYCRDNKAFQQLNEMILFDYLVTNDDRHLNNVAMVCDADTFEVQGLSPIYDNGGGLLPYAVKENLKTYPDLCRYVMGKGPRFYDDFYPQARLSLQQMDSAPIRKLLNLSFKRDYQYSLPEERLVVLEDYVRNQARNLLEGTDPATLASPPDEAIKTHLFGAR